MWQPIETAPKNKPIVVHNGSFWTLGEYVKDWRIIDGYAWPIPTRTDCEPYTGWIDYSAYCSNVGGAERINPIAYIDPDRFPIPDKFNFMSIFDLRGDD